MPANSSALNKARKVKQKNDKKRREKTKRLVDKVQLLLDKKGLSVTEACRKVGIATEKYYRFLKSEKSA